MISASVKSGSKAPGRAARAALAAFCGPPAQSATAANPSISDNEAGAMLPSNDIPATVPAPCATTKAGHPAARACLACIRAASTPGPRQSTGPRGTWDRLFNSPVGPGIISGRRAGISGQAAAASASDTSLALSIGPSGWPVAGPVPCPCGTAKNRGRYSGPPAFGPVPERFSPQRAESPQRHPLGCD